MIELGIGLIFLLVSAFFSGRADNAHAKSIAKAEHELIDVMIFNEKTPPENMQLAPQSLVTGNVVIAASYFKTFVAAIQGLFGGRLANYERTVEYARREALIRMRRQAQQQGASMVINVRLETSAVSKQGGNQSTGAVEIFAYGTALIGQPV